MDRLLTDQEIQKVVDAWVKEDWSVRHIALNRGHWEDIPPIVAKAQDAKTLRAMGKWIEGNCAYHCCGEIEGRVIEDKDMEALRRDEFPEERGEP